jgi:hypothetical protein
MPNIAVIPITLHISFFIALPSKVHYCADVDA